MSRPRKPDWTEVTIHLPKRRRGFFCQNVWFGKPHYANAGDVWACDKCRYVYVCHEHWEQHNNEHYIRELARGKNG